MPLLLWSRTAAFALARALIANLYTILLAILQRTHGILSTIPTRPAISSLFTLGVPKLGSAPDLLGPTEEHRLRLPRLFPWRVVGEDFHEEGGGEWGGEWGGQSAASGWSVIGISGGEGMCRGGLWAPWRAVIIPPRRKPVGSGEETSSGTHGENNERDIEAEAGKQPNEHYEDELEHSGKPACVRPHVQTSEYAQSSVAPLAYVHPHRERRADAEGGRVAARALPVHVPFAYQVERVGGGRWGGVSAAVGHSFIQMISSRAKSYAVEERTFTFTREQILEEGREQKPHASLTDGAHLAFMCGEYVHNPDTDNIPGEFSIVSPVPCVTSPVPGQTHTPRVPVPFTSSASDTQSESPGLFTAGPLTGLSRMRFARYVNGSGSNNIYEIPSVFDNEAAGGLGETATERKEPSAAITRIIDSASPQVGGGAVPLLLGRPQKLRSRFAQAIYARVSVPTQTTPGVNLCPKKDDDACATTHPLPAAPTLRSTPSTHLHHALSALDFWTPAPSVTVKIAAPARRKRRRRSERNGGEMAEDTEGKQRGRMNEAKMALGQILFHGTENGGANGVKHEGEGRILETPPAKRKVLCEVLWN